MAVSWYAAGKLARLYVMAFSYSIQSETFSSGAIVQEMSPSVATVDLQDLAISRLSGFISEIVVNRSLASSEAINKQINNYRHFCCMYCLMDSTKTRVLYYYCFIHECCVRCVISITFLIRVNPNGTTKGTTLR